MKFLYVYLSLLISFLFNLCINAFGLVKVKTIRRTATGMMKSISGFFGSKAETLRSQFKPTTEPSPYTGSVGSSGQHWTENLFYRSISATFDTVSVMLTPIADNSVSANSVDLDCKAKDKDYIIAGFMDYDPKSAAFTAHGKTTTGNKKSALSSDDVGTMFSNSPSATWFVRDL